MSEINYNEQIIQYIDSIAQQADEIKKMSLDIRDLISVGPEKFRSLQWFYVSHIKEEYLLARRLYCLQFHYSALDSCRKIVEFLVRYEQNIAPLAKLDNVRDRLQKGELSWEADNLKKAIDIYNSCSSSVHGQKGKIFEKSRKHSTLDEISASRVLDTKMPSELKHLIAPLKKRLHGEFGMWGFTKQTINDTVDLVNSILSKSNIV